MPILEQKSMPSDNQIREFWEWCGFKQLPAGKTGYHFEQTVKIMNWLYPDGSDEPHLPCLDLNNLFRYAVPKLFAYELHTFWTSLDTVTEQTRAEVWLTKGKSVVAIHKDPALALFLAISEVIKI